MEPWPRQKHRPEVVRQGRRREAVNSGQVPMPAGMGFGESAFFFLGNAPKTTGAISQPGSDHFCRRRRQKPRPSLFSLTSLGDRVAGSELKTRP